MEDKEKYKEALERAKTLYENANGMILKKWVEQVFPELKESEDERIRKAIKYGIKYLESEIGWDFVNDVDILDIYAWLEKQGEPIEINPTEFDLQLNRLLVQFESLSKEELASSLSFYLNIVQNDGTYKDEEKQDEQEDQQKLFDIAKHQGYKEGLRDGRAEVWAQIEKQGEQKQDPCKHCEDKCLNCHNFPCIKKKAFEQGKSVFEISNENPTIVQTTVVQSIEPKFKVGDTIKCTYDNRQFTIKSVDIEKGVYTYTEDGCSNDIDYVDEEFELVKHKPVEWSEDDEEMFDAIIADIQFTQKAHNHEVNQGIYEREMDWLKSLKERSVPQPKQEWNDDDDFIFNDVINAINESTYGNTRKEADINWLKSLRPQSQWKPSEEQIQALDRCADYLENSMNEDADIIDSLWE